jgi:hypothetical protein
MRIPMACMQCLVEGTAPSDFVAVELENSGLYRMVCKANNHETVTCLQAQKFEVLFEIAAHAIVDGYHREAVASFTSALERFYEFCIEIFCDQLEIKEPEFQQAWKRVSQQSERQVGGYIFAYLLVKKRPPLLLSDERARFRNDVIHKGHIPSREQAIDYGEAVAEVMLAALSELRRPDDKYVIGAVFRHLRRLRAQVTTSAVSVMSISTFFSLPRATEQPQPTLREWIDFVRQKGLRLRPLPEESA